MSAKKFTRLLITVAATSVVGSAMAQEPVVLRQGSFAPPGSVFLEYWNKFKVNVERDTKGSIKVELNTNDPNEANLLSNVRRGRIDCVGTSLQGASTVVPEIAVLQAPYLFNSYKEVDHAYGSYLLETYRKLFAAKGLAMLQFVEVGFTNMYGTVPIKSPAEVKGLKMRATQSKASQNWVQAIGAEAVVLPIAEAIPGLQTGLIKGGESGVIIYDAFLAKSAPQYTLTQHSFDSGTIMCNKEWFDKLTPDQRKAVEAGWNYKEQAKDTRAITEKMLAGAAAKGVTVYKPTEPEMQQWRAVAAKASDATLSGLGADALKIRDELNKAIKEVR